MSDEENIERQLATGNDQLAKGETSSPAEPVIEAGQPETLNLSAETLPAGQVGSVKADLKPLNPDMEVHHHTHSGHGNPAHGGTGKNWKTYFWEFFMLFLAVFCGFLAEYQLEHKIERDRGMQYIRSFYIDLKTDTAEFARLVGIYENKKKTFSQKDECFDSLSGHIKSFNPCIVELIRNCSRFPDFVNADQTLLQLKNAGGLRLLRQADADSILDYDKQVRLFIKFETTGFQERQYRIRELLYPILNYKRLMLKKADPTIPVFITNDPEKINHFFVMLHEYAFASNSHLESLKKLNLKAAALINYFKNKYHFD